MYKSPKMNDNQPEQAVILMWLELNWKQFLTNNLKKWQLLNRIKKGFYIDYCHKGILNSGGNVTEK